MALRFTLVTLAVAVAMLFGTVYLFTTMPTGFIPSQDSGFMFAATLGPQDVSFDYMAAHTHAIGEVVRQHPEVDSVGVVRDGRRIRHRVRAHEAARRTARTRWIRSSRNCGRRSLPVPGHLGVHAESAADHDQRPAHGERVPAHAAKRRTWTRSISGRPQLVDKMRQLPGFVDVNSDMQIASPQLMVDIDRDRALALGITPQQMQNALFSAFASARCR